MIIPILLSDFWSKSQNLILILADFLKVIFIAQNVCLKKKYTWKCVGNAIKHRISASKSVKSGFKKHSKSRILRRLWNILHRRASVCLPLLEPLVISLSNNHKWLTVMISYNYTWPKLKTLTLILKAISCVNFTLLYNEHVSDITRQNSWFGHINVSGVSVKWIKLV